MNRRPYRDANARRDPRRMTGSLSRPRPAGPGSPLPGAPLPGPPEPPRALRPGATGTPGAQRQRAGPQRTGPAERGALRPPPGQANACGTARSAISRSDGATGEQPRFEAASERQPEVQYQPQPAPAHRGAAGSGMPQPSEPPRRRERAERAAPAPVDDAPGLPSFITTPTRVASGRRRGARARRLATVPRPSRATMRTDSRNFRAAAAAPPGPQPRARSPSRRLRTACIRRLIDRAPRRASRPPARSVLLGLPRYAARRRAFRPLHHPRRPSDPPPDPGRPRGTPRGRTSPMSEIKLQDLKSKSPSDLLAFADEHEVENASLLRKQELLFAILKELAGREIDIIGQGVVEVLQDGFGYLRSPDANYLAGPGRHLHLAFADPPLRPAHRRHRRGPDPRPRRTASAISASSRCRRSISMTPRRCATRSTSTT